MSQFLDAFWQRPDCWLLLILPVCAAILGALGNWLALRLLFGPLPGAGAWRQGLLGRQLLVVAGGLAHQLSLALQLPELFRLMEPEKIAAHLSDGVLDRLEDYVDDIMSEKNAVLWDNLPELVRRRVYQRVSRQLPSIFDNLIDDMAEHIDRLVDVHEFLPELMQQEPGLLSRLVQESLQEECAWLCRAGALAGFAAGLLAVLCWLLLPRPWLLALLLPATVLAAFLLPRHFLFRVDAQRPGRLQQRQSAVALPLGEGLMDDVLGLRQLMRTLLSGSRVNRTRSMIKRHMRPLLDAGMVRTSLQLMMGAAAYVGIKQRVVDRAVQLTVQSLSDAEFSHERTGLAQEVCVRRLQGMPAADFVAMLRPLLSEAWWLQVLPGLLLAGLTGLGLSLLLAV